LTSSGVRITIDALLSKPVWGPALVLALAGGCVDDEVEDDSVGRTALCGAADAYTPYPGGAYLSGTVAELPWRGESSAYPDGVEKFEHYATDSTIECANDKDKRSHLDVTAGCMTAIALSNGVYRRARVELTDEGHAFRALALGHANGELVKWTDQRSEYRFYYGGTTTAVLPGFKIFARYRSEDDLYVASWRVDGVVQIQRKQCGEYTTLARRTGMEMPSLRAWHRIRFDAIGETLALYLDDKPVLATQSNTFRWGTVGIRIDGATGAYLDDWRVFL
jgi:hypothetical protein